MALPDPPRGDDLVVTEDDEVDFDAMTLEQEAAFYLDVGLVATETQALQAAAQRRSDDEGCLHEVPGPA